MNAKPAPQEPTQQEPRKPSKIELASQVAARVQIQELRLLETSASNRIDPANETPIQLDIMAETKADVTASRIVVWVNLRLIGHYQKSVKRDPVVQIQTTYEVSYELKDSKGLSKAHFDAFGEV